MFKDFNHSSKYREYIIVNSARYKYWLVSPILISLVCMTFYLITQPTIGIRDIDSASYILGARGFYQGKGYRDLQGAPLNHWPPGYSWLLSFFDDHINASKIINAIGLGICVFSLYSILRESKWPSVEATSLSLILGLGFFRYLATTTKPDVLTYGLFLLALYGWRSNCVITRYSSLITWSGLILVKFIAVVFVPSTFIASFIINGFKNTIKTKEILVGCIAWLFCVSFILLFNYYTIGVWMAPTHSTTTVEHILNSLIHFSYSVPRTMLAAWHGSVASSGFMLPFIVAVSLGVISVLFSKFNRNNVCNMTIGILILSLSFSMQLIKAFGSSARLMGYGILACFSGITPLKGSRWLWISYATMGIIVIVINVLITTNTGLNNPEYRALSEDIKNHLTTIGYDSNKHLYTNTFKMLDVHANIFSRPVSVEAVSCVPKGGIFIYMNIKNYDDVATIVWDVPLSIYEWNVLVNSKYFKVLEKTTNASCVI